MPPLVLLKNYRLVHSTLYNSKHVSFRCHDGASCVSHGYLLLVSFVNNEKRSQ